MEEDVELRGFENAGINPLSVGAMNIDGEILCGEQWVCDLITKYLNSPLVVDPELKSSSIEVKSDLSFFHLLKVCIGTVTPQQAYKFKERVDKYIKEELNLLYNGY